MIKKVEAYLSATKPLGKGTYRLFELASGEYNLNYILEFKGKRYVVRVSIAQLSGNKDQLQSEFLTLKYLQRRGIAPKVFYLDMKGFEHPLLIEEFIHGGPLRSLSKKNLSLVAKVLAKVSKVALGASHPFEKRKPSYQRDIDGYLRVFNSIKHEKCIASWKKKTQEAFVKVRRIARKNQALLDTVKPALIKRDSNPTNFILTKNAIKIIDWELARIDDPTISLASFINEVEQYDFFSKRLTAKQKEFLINEYLKEHTVKHFRELLENRLLLERLWGLVWALERIYLFKHNKIPKSLRKKSKFKWYRMIAKRSYGSLIDSLEQ